MQLTKDDLKEVLRRASDTGIMRRVLPPIDLVESGALDEEKAIAKIWSIHVEGRDPLQLRIPCSLFSETEALLGGTEIVPSRAISPVYNCSKEWFKEHEGGLPDLFLGAVNQVLWQEDKKFFEVVRVLCLDEARSLNFISEERNSLELEGLTRDSLVEAFKLLGPRNARVVMNKQTFDKVLTLSLPGGTDSFLKDGTILGVSVIVTLRNEEVHDGEIFFFAKPEELGVNLSIEPLNIITKEVLGTFQFFAYSLSWSTIDRVDSLARATFF